MPKNVIIKYNAKKGMNNLPKLKILHLLCILIVHRCISYLIPINLFLHSIKIKKENAGNKGGIPVVSDESQIGYPQRSEVKHGTIDK